MDERRQKPEVPDCEQISEGETKASAKAGFESPMACQKERGSTATILEEILEKENIKAAVTKVQRNGGAPGVDGITVNDLISFMAANWDRVQKELMSATYQPKPVRQVEIPKPGGGKRKLGIPTVLDRVIQQAFLQVLQPMLEPTFSDNSYGFRPGRSQHQAIEAVRGAIQDGFEYVVDLDLEKFFDRVNHDILMARVAARLEDKRVLKILRSFLNAGILSNGLVEPSLEGVPQGGPLSPLLSNLMLDDLDKELERRQLRFVRYADDCNIYVKSERAGLRVKENITRFLSKKLRLKVNEGKSAVGKPQSRTFLGYTFGECPEAKRLISKQAMKRARQTIRIRMEQAKRTTLERTIESIGRYLRGWLQYYGHTDRITDIITIFGYARRRLRRQAWQNWKTPATRRKQLMQGGVSYDTAYAVSHTSKGAWRLSASPPLQHALPNHYFSQRGFPSSLNGRLL